MSNNGLILHITAAGRAQRIQARLNGSALPKFSGWVVDRAETQDVDAPTLQPLYTSKQGGECLVERIDETAIGVRILIPVDFHGWVRGLALLTEDGTVYAYARFAEENGGLYKPIGTAIRQLLILAEDGRETVEFSYSVIDISLLREQITAQVRNELNIPHLAALLQDALKLCAVDGNDNNFGINGGDPDPQCQLIPTDQHLTAVDGGIL